MCTKKRVAANITELIQYVDRNDLDVSLVPWGVLEIKNKCYKITLAQTCV